MHPGTRILLALLSALALPGLSFFYLLGLSLPLSLLAFAQAGRASRLLWRSRWLLLALWLLPAFQIPGPAWLEAWSWGPSRPGLEAGLLHAWRLIAMLLLIDLLVLRLPAEALLSGMVAVLWPLRAVGLSTERLAVRLGLTLRALAGHERRGLFDLDAAEAAASALPDRLTMRLQPWRALDSALLAGGLSFLAWSWLSA